MTTPEFNVKSAPAGAIKTASGLEYVIVSPNPDGAVITPKDWILVHYSGWTTDGNCFDTSTDGAPAVFPIEQLIDGMREALCLCRTGEKMRVWIPEDLAYKGVRGMPQGTLVFEFRVIDIVTPKAPPLEVPADAIKLHDGLAYRIDKRGPGERTIMPEDIVNIDFNGWRQTTGEMFHSSMQMGEPLVGEVHKFFPGFRETLVFGHAGDEMTVWVPQPYGVDPKGDYVPGVLVFTVVIHEVTQAPEPLPAPDDVAAAPADAVVTKTGLASKVLTVGDGKMHPTSRSRVRVHYTGWTTDGKMFDSSVLRGEPSEFGLNQVIAGWTEGVQLMVEGETRRFWIPEALAYRGMAGAPAGMLVFDVTLLAIL
ncbi:MAG: FKBP-type peptidyl-prolyl cis-trans isomerase [Proteobacteria bacterium]|nr:FKBP-type peptidyl-prolyl cis-trans isomerase [Pseudomonadota bacterium]